MIVMNKFFLGVVLVLGLVLSGCSGENSLGKSNKPNRKAVSEKQQAKEEEPEKIWDLFKRRVDENVTIAVNKYLWVATLEVLDFLPLEQADPFSGVIIFGYGKAPGASQSYRATILISDPALDLRSLNLALATQSGPVSEELRNRVENAILTRARQLRLRDKEL